MPGMLFRFLTCRMNITSTQLSRRFCIRPSVVSDETPVISYTNYLPTKVVPKDPPVILLHGLLGSKRNLAFVGKSIAASGRRVISVDARNHGDSSHVSGMDYPSMCNDVEKLLHKLKISKAIILGHSMGGKTAMCLAVNKPHLVEKLIVEDIIPNPKRTVLATAFKQHIGAIRNVHFDSEIKTLTQARKTAGQQLKEAFPNPEHRAFILTNVRQTEDGFDWKVNIEAIERNLDALVGFPTLQGKYNGHTLFIFGGNSMPHSEDDVEAIRSLFPHAILETIHGAGHWVHSDKPRDFVNMVKEFIDNLNS